MGYKYLTLWQYLMKPPEYSTPFSVLHAVSLLSHRQRIDKFQLAIYKTLQSVIVDSIVIDLGTGSGILALVAASLGAEKVYAVDVNLDNLIYAKKAAEMNDLSNKIEFVHSHFSDFYPDEKADIVICEMLSSMMLVEQQVPACHHAVHNLLRDGGTILPQSATVYVVPVEAQYLHGYYFDELVFPKVPQTVGKDDTRDLADAQELVTFDFSSKEDQSFVHRELEFQFADSGMIDGMLGMFEANFYDDGPILKMLDGWRPLFLPTNSRILVERDKIKTLKLSYTAGEYDSYSLVFY